MDGTQDKYARVMPVVFGQLEMLGDLALKAGETTLAADLSAALANALFRFADAGGVLDADDEDERRAG